MAKGVGLDAGEYEIKVVELDGSYRKPRLAKVSIDRVSQLRSAAVDETHAAREAEVALQALKDAKISRDNVILGFPCREAVLRKLVVPFRGVDQIRKVIKFEVEESIHSHSVDDMVVDFHVIEEVEDGTRVLVAAVPKQPLRVTLEALNELGIDPEIVDLDTMALYRVADWAGCFSGPIELPPGEVDMPPANPDSRSMRIIIDVGGRSTRVLAVVDGQIEDMRALRVGVDAVAEEIATHHDIDLPSAREAVFRVFETGQDHELGAADAIGDDDDEDGEEREERAVVSAERKVITASEVSGFAKELLRRLHREFMRFVASMQGIDNVEAVWVTGGGSFMPGIDEVIGDVFGVPPKMLPILEHLNHNLDEDEARWVEPRIAVAVGLALGPMGGISSLQFRLEDLAFQRRFDRIKFPLAIACMLTVFLLFIVGMQKKKQIDALAQDYGATFKVERTEASGRQKSFVRATLYGYVGNLIDEGSRYSCKKQLERKEYYDLVEKVVEADTFDRLGVIESYLRKKLKDKREATGIYTDLQLPSGYLVVAKFAELMEKAEAELGSFIVMSIDMNLGGKTPYFEFKIALRGEGYRSRFDNLKSLLENSFADPASPFAAFSESRGSGEDVFVQESPSDPQGAINVVRLELKEPKL